MRRLSPYTISTLDNFVETAKNKRWCHVCNNEIKPNEKHMASQVIGYHNHAQRRNICTKCILTLADKLEIENGIKDIRE